MNSLYANTFSNIAVKIWSMISIYIFIPLYIEILGETVFGLVSFFATLQSTLNLLGLGLSNTLRREFAVGEVSIVNNNKKYKLLRSTELIYLCLGIVIIYLCTFGANVIATKWLNIENMDAETVADVIALMGVSIALQLNANLYAGCLLGINKQVKANVLCICWSFCKSAGALLVIIILQPNLLYFYLWHILADFVYLVLLRISIITELRVDNDTVWRFSDISNIKLVWKYTCGIIIISFIALVNKQADKFIISKYLTLTELGAYNVATTLASLTSIIPSALYTSMFPRFTYYATTGNIDSLKTEFISANKIVNLIISCMGAYIAIYATQLIIIWTGSTEYACILRNVAAIIVVAVTLVECQVIPYALALANGNTKFNVIVGGVFMPVLIVSMLIGIKYFGLLGASIICLLTMFSQTVIYQFLIYRHYITDAATVMVFKCTILPLMICISLAGLSKIAIQTITDKTFLQCTFAVLCGSVTLIFAFFLFARDELITIKKILIRRK